MKEIGGEGEGKRGWRTDGYTTDKIGKDEKVMSNEKEGMEDEEEEQREEQ